MRPRFFGQQRGLWGMNTDELREFFEAYARAGKDPEPTSLARNYADSFVVSGPSGSAVFKNDEQFLQWLREVYEFNQRVGMQSLEVVSVHETQISSHHVFARVEWGVRFTRTDDQRIMFEISYLLRLSDDRPLILAYVSHEDQMEVMKAWSII